MKTGLLQVEQLALYVEAAAVTAQRAAGRDHAVAGDDNGDGIPVVRHADGTVGMRVADGLSDVAVATGLAVWNFEQRMPARELELGSSKIERQRELATLAGKVFVEFSEIGRKGCFGLMQRARTGIQFLHAGFEFESHQAFCGGGEEEWSGGRRRADV